MAEINYQLTFDEDQELATQPIYLSSDERAIFSSGPSPGLNLPNNVPDTYSAITHLIAAQHEQMSSSGNSALQNPNLPTPPNTLISDDEWQCWWVFTPLIDTVEKSNPKRNLDCYW